MSGSEKRTPKAWGSLKADEPSGLSEQGPTIVGGQPPKQLHRTVSHLPVGIEKVVYTAAVDPGFRRDVMSDRMAAVEGRGFDLTPSERGMLNAIPDGSLAATIDSMDVTASNLRRRSFMRAVAASAVTIAAGEALSGCADDDSDVKGIRPDMPVNQRDLGPDYGNPTEGIRPDLPPNLDAGPSRGISPDIPPQADYQGSYGIRPDK